MLMRILRDNKSWPIFLYRMSVFVVLVAVVTNVFQLSLCKPLSAVCNVARPSLAF